jgi:hypothetical protein
MAGHAAAIPRNGQRTDLPHKHTMVLPLNSDTYHQPKGPNSSSQHMHRRRPQWRASLLLAPLPALLLGACLTATVSFWLGLSLEQQHRQQEHQGDLPPSAAVENALESNNDNSVASLRSSVVEDPTVLGTAACLCVMDDNHFLKGAACWLLFSCVVVIVLVIAVSRTHHLSTFDLFLLRLFPLFFTLSCCEHPHRMARLSLPHGQFDPCHCHH